MACSSCSPFLLLFACSYRNLLGLEIINLGILDCNLYSLWLIFLILKIDVYCFCLYIYFLVRQPFLGIVFWKKYIDLNFLLHLSGGGSSIRLWYFWIPIHWVTWDFDHASYCLSVLFLLFSAFSDTCPISNLDLIWHCYLLVTGSWIFPPFGQLK